MSAIRITVTREASGFTFSILPSVCALITTLVPGAHPGTRLSLSYDSPGNFDILQTGAEKHIYPALLGADKDQLKRHIDKIEFINGETGKVQKAIIL